MLHYEMDCDLSCDNTGTKSGLVEAFQSGKVVSLGGKTAPIKQYATNLEHWLHTDALYGVQYTKVSLPYSLHITKASAPILWEAQCIPSSGLSCIQCQKAQADLLLFLVDTYFIVGLYHCIWAEQQHITLPLCTALQPLRSHWSPSPFPSSFRPSLSVPSQLFPPPFLSALAPSSFQSSLKVPSQPAPPFLPPPPALPPPLTSHLSTCLLSIVLAALQGFTPLVPLPPLPLLAIY